MNIWILNHYAISPKSIGGTRHYDLAQELIKEGHTVRIFASSFNHFNRKETIAYGKGVIKEEVIDDVSFIWIKAPGYKSSAKRLVNISVFSLRLNNAMNKYFKKEKPDVIIGSSVHPLTPLVGIRKAKKEGSLFYFEERDLWPQTFIDFGILSEKNIVTKLLFKLEKYLYQNADKVIFLFENAHKYAEGKGLSKNNLLYLPNGFSEERASELIKSNEIDKLINSLYKKKLCVYVGSMGEANHMIPLLELAKSMDDEEEYHFLFVGNGSLKQTLIVYMKENGLKNVTFHDSIPKEQIPYLLSHAHCGLISMKNSPLYKWGFSMNKIYDYLSLGLPIIMYTDLDSLGVLDNANGISTSNDIYKLKSMLLNSAQINREEIKRFAHKHYSWEVLAKQLLVEMNQDLIKKQDIESRNHVY